MALEGKQLEDRNFAPSDRPHNAPGALFTDFTDDALGVRRNADILANETARYFQQERCAAARSDLARQDALSGALKLPRLRNVALRWRSIHSGRFSTLLDVVAFDVRREMHAAHYAAHWSPLDGFGSSISSNALPDDVPGNANTSEPPFDRRAGSAPALDASENADLVAFLRPLTDGYMP